MKKIFVFIIAILISISPLFLLSGCSVKTIDKLAYVISIGFDKGENDKLEIFFEISTPTGSGSGSTSSDSGSSEKSSSSTIISVECSSIDSGVNLLNSYLSKEVDLSHCNIIVFSSELAKEGIHDYIYTLINNVEVRPSCDILVSTCSIEDFFINSSYSLENYSSNYETLNENLTGYTEIVSISDFFSKTTDSFGEPCAILCGLSSNDISTLNKESSTNSSENKKEENSSTLKTLGLAIFKQDKLVGYLSPLETFVHLIITNELKNCTVSVPSPFEDKESIDIYLTRKNNTKIKVDIVDGKPQINVNCFLTAKISSVSNNHKYLDEKNIRLLEKATNDYIKQLCLNYFEITSRKYKSDIGGLGKYAVSKFLTWDDWNNFDWQSVYKNASFNVNVDTTITSSYLLLDT